MFKRVFTHNWQIKLVSVILAATVWYLIKKSIPDDQVRALPSRPEKQERVAK